MENSKSTQIINPGPSKEIWDEVLTRHGINPDEITEYNVRQDEGYGEEKTADDGVGCGKFSP